MGKSNIDFNGWEFVLDMCNKVYNNVRPITGEVVFKTLGEIGFKN